MEKTKYVKNLPPLKGIIVIDLSKNPEKKEPIWHSIWASTTFAIPESNP